MHIFDHRPPKEKIMRVVDKVRKKKLISRYTILLFSLFISACYFNLLQLQTHVVTGGTSGISIITENLFGWEPSIVILISSTSLLILSFIFLGVEKSSGAVIATFVYPLFVELTKDLPYYFPVDTSDMLLISIFLGIIAGITTGLTFKVGFSNGGISILSQILYKYKKIAISTTSLWINMIIVLIGGFSFGWTMVMYAIIILYINSLMIDRVMIGISKNKTVYIMTSEESEIKQFILEELKHGVTVFNVKGGFLEKKRLVLMTVVPNSEYFRLTEGVKMIDPKVFFIVMDSYQVSGGA